MSSRLTTHSVTVLMTSTTLQARVFGVFKANHELCHCTGDVTQYRRHNETEQTHSGSTNQGRPRRQMSQSIQPVAVGAEALTLPRRSSLGATGGRGDSNRGTAALVLLFSSDLFLFLLSFSLSSLLFSFFLSSLILTPFYTRVLVSYGKLVVFRCQAFGFEECCLCVMSTAGLKPACMYANAAPSFSGCQSISDHYHCKLCHATPLEVSEPIRIRVLVRTVALQTQHRRNCWSSF